MKKHYVLILLVLVLSACGEREPKNGKNELKTPQNEPKTPDYPGNLTAVFDAHGGMEKWDSMQTLYFEMGEDADKQKHTVDLHSRKSLTQTPNFTMGFNGSKTWLVQDSTYMQPERAQYMHNLMFYFFAMPFVLGDPGIQYTAADTLQFEGKKYPGIKIVYDAGIGASDKDEYILCSDPESHKMTWLAYTATFGNTERAENFSYIKYDKWKDIDGILLPTALQWYNVADGQPTAMRNEATFENISLSTEKENGKIFEKPENGVFSEGE